MGQATGRQTLSAVADGLRFTLRLTPRKPPVIHGENGVSQKAAGAGKASYYVSFPRLAVEGTLNGAAVSGTRLDGSRMVHPSAGRRSSAAGTGSASNSTTARN